MRKALMLVSLATLAAAAPAAAATCTGAGAHYTIAGGDGFELILEKAKEPMAWSDLDVFLKTPTRTFRYSLTASNGYSYNYLVQEDPRLPASEDDGSDAGSYRVFLFSKDMAVLDLPQAAAPAPDFIFIPDLGGALWYGSEPREFLPTAMWRLKDCG